MATCPECSERNNIDLQPTGESKFRASELTSVSLAGAQMKIAAVAYREFKLSFLCCNKYVLGYIEGEDFYSSDQVIYNE